MKVDVIVEAGASAAQVLELGQLAEAVGLNAIWISAFPGRRDPFVTLPGLAAATSRIQLGVMPVSPYEIHPTKLAEQLYSLNEIANGRAQILVGGLGKSVMNATGLAPKRRVRAVEETLAILRGARSQTPMNFAGEIYQARNFHLPFATSTAAPVLYVAANGPQMLAMAGRSADGVMLSDVTTPLFPQCMESLSRGLQRRTLPSPLLINNFWAWHIKADRQAAWAEARRELVWRGALQRSHIEPFLNEEQCELVAERWQNFLDAFLTQSDRIKDVPDDVVTALVEGLTFTGDLQSLDAVADRIRELESAGQSEIALRLHQDPAAAIENIGKRLLPQLS